MDNTVLLNYQKKVIRKTSALVEVSSDARTVSVHVKPAVNKQPDRVIVSPMDDVKPTVSDQPDRFMGSPIVNTGGRNDCLRRMGQTPRDRDNDSDNVTKQVVELLPVSRVVVQNKTAEEVIIVECPVGQVVKNETTKPTVSTELVNLPQKWITRGFLELAEEARLVDVRSTPSRCMNRVVVQNKTAEEVIIVECPVGQVVKNETTKPTVSTELVNLPQEWITRGFLELAEEARLVDVRLTPSGCMKENVQQSSEIREPMSRNVSWSIEEVVDRSVDSFSDVAIRMPTVRFDEGQLMQWPSGKSTGMMICEYTLESQMFSHGPVWREAEPVFVAAESEVFTPVFTGEFVVQTDPLVVAEAVTPRVSALPTVGSEFQTGLSTSVGREDRYSLGLGNILDKVGHVAGQLKVRTVPVEDLLLFSAVYFVMPSLLRLLTVQTSTFFLSDEREEVSMPLSMREDRPIKTRRLYVQEVDMRAQMTKEIHGVGPNGDRWDGIDVIDEWYMGCVWMKSQPGNRARLVRGNNCSEKFGLESGPAVRIGPSVLDLDWRNGHPNRSDCPPDTIRSARIRDGSLSHQPSSWQYTSVCYYMFDSLAALLEMSSASFLKSISESNYDKLYDLPAGIPDVMGLQALRPSAAVCKVMSIPDSNSVRVITPDEHVPTGFHEILIEDMGLKEWPKVALSEIGCLRLDWPQEFFTFVGRYQLELEQMRKECRDRFEGISSGACPTCEKFIQNNLGRHVAMYHLDLAQLWRCPVGWCPVWKGTSQDCIDHMRRAHNTPITMKAGNLARWFPPWTVTREQWHNMSRPSVSGIAIDTFLFSRIGMSLFHRYRVFDRFGSHPAFRRPYMTNIFVFLKESDSEAIRRSHRRRARELAAGMSQPASQPASVTRNVMSRTIQSGPAPQRTVVSNVMGQKTGTLLVTPAGGASGSSGISRNGRSREDDTVQALMDLSLPRFTRLDDGRLPKTKLWPITEQPPSSPASVRDGNITRTPSSCYQLDDLTSASSTGGRVTNDYRLTLLTDSSNSMTPVGSIVSFSDDDLPLESDQEDTRQVQRRDLDDDVPPGPSGVPEYIPLSGQKTVEDPIYTPTPRDKLVRVPISRVSPADENMFDPMLGEWPVDDLAKPEEMTRNKPAGGKSFRPKPTAHPFALIRETIPKLKPSGERPYELRPRDKPVGAPKLNGRPVDGWEYEPLNDERPAHSGAQDEMSDEEPVDHPQSGTRPVGVRIKTPRSERQPGEDTAYKRILRDGRVPPITEEGQSQEEGNDQVRRLEEGDGTTRMTGGGPDAGPGTMSGTRRGEALSVPAPQLHLPPPPSEVPDWSDGEAMPLIIIEASSVPPTPTKTIDGLLVDSDGVLRLSPEMNSSGDPGILSAPLSPNRVRTGHSQDMPAEGSLFDVSPDIPGFHMRPAGASVQQADITEPPPPNYVGFDNPFFGTPIAFAQCRNTAGMDTTTTLPVYSIPRNCSVGVDQSSVPTVYASGVTPDTIPWSTAEDIIRDIAREGPFDPDTTPMDTEDSPLINASMPGCPFRMTSYTGPAMVDADTRYGLQLHHPRFLEFIGAPESARLLNQSPSFWVDRLGQESAMAAAVNLQRDAGFMMTNLQILGQFVMSLHRMSAEMLSIGVNHVVFPVDEVDRLSVMPRAQRAAKYMSAMGLWRPLSGAGTPGPLPVSTCTSCMQCESCFGRRGPSAQ